MYPFLLFYRPDKCKPLHRTKASVWVNIFVSIYISAFSAYLCGMKKPKLEEDVTCSGCGVVQKIWNVIDNWIVKEDKTYCGGCQKKMKIGRYAETTNAH